jgi:hypothetical protein
MKETKLKKRRRKKNQKKKKMKKKMKKIPIPTIAPPKTSSKLCQYSVNLVTIIVNCTT